MWLNDRTHLDSADAGAQHCYVERLLAATKAYGSNTEIMIATRAAGAISHVLGDQKASRRYLEAFIDQYQAPQIYSPTKRFHFDQEVAALAFYSRVLWLQGGLEAGRSAAANAIERASGIGHIHSICHALAQACIPLAFQSEDFGQAEQQIGRLQDLATSRGLWVWDIWSKKHLERNSKWLQVAFDAAWQT